VKQLVTNHHAKFKIPISNYSIPEIIKLSSLNLK